MLFQAGFLPLLLLVSAALIAFPLSRYVAQVMDGKLRSPSFLRWIERRLDSGPQNWKQYTASLLIFNTVLFVFGFLVLALQPWMPLNPDGKGMLAPSTIFNSVMSFMTNTNLQHYSGEQHLSNFSQIFFGIANLFLSAAVGLMRADGDHPGLARRGARRQLLRGYVAGGGLHVPARALIFGLIFISAGHAR